MNSVPHGKPSQRLLVVGCGYVGTALAKFAQRKGLAVTALTRNVQAADHLASCGIPAVVADAAGDEWHRQVSPAPEYVLNCLSGGGGALESYRHSYLDGMQSILRWARTCGPVGTCVYTSSTSVYPHTGGVGVAEGDLDAGVDRDADSGREQRAEILRDAERSLTASRDACERWFILRLAGIYGPGRHGLLEQVRRGEVAGNGDHHLNLVYRDDIVAAVWACFTAPPRVRNEVFNVADDGAEPKRAVAEWIAHRIGVPPPAFTGAAAPGRSAITPDRVILNNRIKDVLGWDPRFRSFRDGYEAILAGAK